MLSGKVLILCAFFMVISTVLALSERSSVLPYDVMLIDNMSIRDAIQNYNIKYYYIDLRAYQKLEIEYYSTGDGLLSGTQDIYMQELSKPTVSSFLKKSSFESHVKKMESPIQTQNKRIWLGVKSVNEFVGRFNFKVRIVVTPAPKQTPTPAPAPTPNPDCNCKNEVVGYGLTPIIGLTIPSIVISLSLLIVVVVQFKKMNEISKKITELERRLQSNDQEMPIMNVPLLENVQNNSSQEQAIQNQQYPIVYQLPNQMYPQMIQHQANAQPMVFVPSQQQAVNQQPLSHTPSKQL